MFVNTWHPGQQTYLQREMMKLCHHRLQLAQTLKWWIIVFILRKFKLLNDSNTQWDFHLINGVFVLNHRFPVEQVLVLRTLSKWSNFRLFVKKMFELFPQIPDFSLATVSRRPCSWEAELNASNLVSVKISSLEASWRCKSATNGSSNLKRVFFLVLIVFYLNFLQVF